MNEPNANEKTKLLLVMAAYVFYIVSPIDLVPDVIPVIGWLDDLGVLGLLIRTCLSFRKAAATPSPRQPEPDQCVIEVPAKVLE